MTGSLDVALSRAYYAMFYATGAVLEPDQTTEVCRWPEEFLVAARDHLTRPFAT